MSNGIVIFACKYIIIFQESGIENKYYSKNFGGVLGLINLTKIFLLTILLFLFISSQTVYAQSQLDSLKNLLASAQGKEKIKLLIETGYFLSSENPKEAIKFLDQAIDLAKETNESWSLADAYFNKGVALWHIGEITESDKQYELAIPIYEELNDSISLIKVFNSQAINHHLKGNIEKTFNTFFHSLDYARKVGDRTTIVNTLINIGVTYDNNGDLNNSLKYYYDALELVDEKDKATLALLQSYIAEVYLTLKNHVKAEEYVKKALENSKASNETKSLIWAYSSLGKIELEKKNYNLAEKYFQESLSLSDKTDFKLEIIHSLTDLGRFYSATNKLNESEDYLHRALLLTNELNSLSDLSIIYRELAALYSKKHNYKEAFEYHQKYKTISDSLFTLSNTAQIADLQTKHELKRVESESELLKVENELQKKVINSQKIIALIISIFAVASIIFIWILLRNRSKILKTRNELFVKHEEINIQRKEISQKNLELANLNATKDKFFSIIAHDLRNPIAAFVNISDLLEHDFDRLSNSDKKEIIAQMNVSSKNLIILLENLLTWARLSNKKIEMYPEELILSDVIESSITPYKQSAQNKKIKIVTEFSNEIIIYSDKYMIQTIVGNLINNAIKFSNSLSEIIISVKDNNDHYLLSIKDHGIGIEESQLRNIFLLGETQRGRGTLGESGTGL
ncbi:MAG: tetratricopeptide repeat-containing sensor histidine kinase, partial [Ignavibacteriaceae bacterium]|nr:tetratricopeptide repeat-containing sensor histidine kinase [Ignavibacteriaceae bacterium]